MAKDVVPAKTTVDEQQASEVALINDAALLEHFAEMALMIPGDDGSGTEAILAAILGAQTWEELDAPWETSDIEDILGKTLRVTAVKRMPSTFAGGLGVFLVVNLRDISAGKEYVKTTGSISVVAQLARAYALDLSDLIIEWKRAERPSKNGYYPQHLQVISATSSGTPQQPAPAGGGQ